MRHLLSTALLTIALATLCVNPARASAHIQFIDMGTPTNGPLVMNGWRGIVVRITLDNGLPITGVEFGNASPVNGFIFGNLAQRWTDPTGQANYTVTSPGPDPANNSFASDLNFDSHFLGTPDTYSIVSIGEASGSGFFPGRTGLPSDGFVGYGATLPRTEDMPIFYVQGGHLAGEFDVRPPFQQSSLDVAYLVLNGPVVVFGNVRSGDQLFDVSGLVVPEPSSAGLLATAAASALLRRRRRAAGPPQIHCEPLESRVQLTVPAPSITSVTLNANNSAIIAWDDIAGESGYAVEKSYDGASGWFPVHTGSLPAGTTQYNDSYGSIGWYRVRAIDASGSAPSAAVQVSGGPTGPVSTLYLEAEALAAGGIKIKWRAGVPEPALIYRRSADGSPWPLQPIVSGVTGTEWTDTTAGVGESFEYRVHAGGSAGAYIYAANARPAIHDRGTVLLVVDQTVVDGTGASLQPDINQFSNDLIGEGYRVEIRTVPRADIPRSNPPSGSTPQQISDFFAPWRTSVMQTKAVIRSVWNIPGIELKSVVLIGRVPIPYSGRIPADGHTATNVPPDHRGAWPTDIFYATLTAPDSSWTMEDDDTQANVSFPENYNYPGDGKFDTDSLSELRLAPGLPPGGVYADVPVGRIDFAGMSYFTGSPDVGDNATDQEVAALHTYFVKNHQFRTGQWDVKRQALVDGWFPLITSQLSPNVGALNVKRERASAPWNLDPNLQNHALNYDTWLWSSVGSGGARSGGFDYVRTEGTWPGVVTDRDFSAADFFYPSRQKHQSVFNFVYGSYVGDWDWQNSTLRASLAESDGFGLTSAWGPDWRVHRMGIGDPIGRSLLLTQNEGSRTVDTSLMGDPTLRQDAVKPAANVTATRPAGQNVVSWQASADPAVDGYFVYRATDPNGPWTLLNSIPVQGTSYTDAQAPSLEGRYYMVRARKLETTPGGTYYNLSVGAVSRPALSYLNFFWQGHVPDSVIPWKQWVDLQFNQDVDIDPAHVAVAGQLWNGTALVPTTLQYNVDYKIITLDDFLPERVKYLVFLDPHDGDPNTDTPGLAPNGIWTVTLDPAAATNAFGQTLAQAHTLDFVNLVADADNDGDVDFDDHVRLAQNYNQPIPATGTYECRLYGDFNCDGVVDFNDLVLLAQNYNIDLTP